MSTQIVPAAAVVVEPPGPECPDRAAMLGLILAADLAVGGLPMPNVIEFRDEASRPPGDHVLFLHFDDADQRAQWGAYLGATLYCADWHGWGVAVFSPRTSQVVPDGNLPDPVDERIDELVTLLTEPSADEIVDGAA